jgi:outer membrane lipoprotein-sorting protein
MSLWIRTLLVVIGTNVLSITAASAQADLDSVERDLEKAWQKHDSMTANVRMTADRKVHGQSVRSHSQGTYEWLRKDEAVVFRLEIETALEIEANGQETERKSKVLTVYDGEYMHTYAEEAGRKQVVKTKLDPKLGPDVRAFFQVLREQSDLRLLAAERVGGKAAHVIQATPKKPRPDGQTYRYYFSKDDGVLLKTTLCDDKGSAVETTTFTDFDFDSRIDPERFVFQAPSGAKVIDLTRQTP